MSEQGNTLSYALTPNLGRSAKSVAVKRYSAQMKSAGEEPDTYRFTASRKVTVR